MRNRHLKQLEHQLFPQKHHYQQSPQQQQSTSHPLKSPSPDKKRANIITPTLSPQLNQIKRNILLSNTPKERRFKPTVFTSKQKDQQTRYYTNEDFQQYKSSQKKRNEYSSTKERQQRQRQRQSQHISNVYYNDYIPLKSQYYQTTQQNQPSNISHIKMIIPQEFKLNISSQSYYENNPLYSGTYQYPSLSSQKQKTPKKSHQLDYIRLLQQKQRTIKQLHEIIQMINRNNSLDLSNSQFLGNTNNAERIGAYTSAGFTGEKQLGMKNNRNYLKFQDQDLDKFIASQKKSVQKQPYQSYGKTVMSYKTNDLSTQKQLKNQIRILTIENQQLIHLIQKHKGTKSNAQMDQKDQSQEYKSKLKKSLQNQQNQSQKQQNLINQKIQRQILIRQVNQLKQSLSRHQNQQSRLYKQNQQLYRKYCQLDEENKKLMRMMKDKQVSDKKYYSTMMQSNTSVRSSSLGANQNNYVEQQNLVTKQGISQSQLIAMTQSKEKQKDKLILIKIKQQYNQNIKIFESSVQQKIQDIMQKMQQKINQFEKKFQQMQQNVIILEKFKAAYENIKNKEKQEQINSNQQQSLIQELKTKRYQQIESLLLQKTQNYQKQLQNQRNQIEQLQRQLSKYKNKQKNYEIILQQKQNQIQNLQLECQKLLKQSQKNEQIQDIQARMNDQQIQKLRESLKKRQTLYEQQKSNFLQQIQEIKQKNQKFGRLIQDLRNKLSQKQTINQSQLTEKERQLLQAQSVIDQLKIIISEKQLQQPDHNYYQNLQRQNSHMKEKLAEQIQKIQQKDQYIKQTEEKMEETVKQLINNYQTQINILKNTLSNNTLSYKASMDEKNSQIANLLKQAENTQNIFLNAEALYKKQIQLLKSTIKELQNLLTNKNKESTQLLHQKSALQQEHASLKTNLQKLLDLSHQVQQLQLQNQQNKNKIIDYEKFINELKLTISNQSQAMQQQSKVNSNLRERIDQLSQQIDKFNKLKVQFEQLQRRLAIVRKQSQDSLIQKDVQIAQQISRYQQQKAEYQVIVKQLKEQALNKSEQVDQLRQNHLKLQQNYNQLLLFRDGNILPELYDLRQTILTNITMISSSSSIGDKDYQYDLGKLYIEYQHKIQEVKQLNEAINQLKDSNSKQKQQKFLLQQKITFLQKNIGIYEQQLKQRKIFCEKLITEKTKVQKQLLLIKKLKLQSKNQENTKVRENILNRVNKLVQIQEDRDKKISNLINREHSPIKLMSGLISRVSNYGEFTLHQ